MKKIILAFGLLLSLIAGPSFAYDNGIREHGFHENHGEHAPHMRREFDRHEFREYHGWVFDFPSPVWIAPEVYCKEYTINVEYVNEYGQYYIVAENHIECLDYFGQWRLVR